MTSGSKARRMRSMTDAGASGASSQTMSMLAVKKASSPSHGSAYWRAPGRYSAGRLGTAATRVAGVKFLSNSEGWLASPATAAARITPSSTNGKV